MNRNNTDENNESARMTTMACLNGSHQASINKFAVTEQVRKYIKMAQG